MPASIHPPVQLTVVLDEESYEGGDSVEMARRFAAVAPAEIVRASKGSQRANVLRFDLGTDAVTAEADEDPLWRDALTTWLDEEFAETSALVARENDARANNGKQPVLFSWAEVKFGTGPVIAIRMKDSAIPPEAAGFVTRARMLLVAGTFGADPIAAIRIPACASIEAQQDGSAAGDAGSFGEEAPADQVARDLEAIGREERGSTSASDILAAVDAVIDDEGAGTSARADGWSAADPDDQNAWAGSTMEQDGPTRAELDDALAEAEAALRHGSDPADADAEERAVASEEDQPPASVRTDEASEADDDSAREGAGEGGRAFADRGSNATADDRARDDASGEGCALSGGEVPADLSYRVWNVAYVDGTSVRYDSVLGEALLD